ncbi:tetratricopeptide repeat protein [Gallionella capsiferriformans]|uniref:Tetratricopeptide TPR_2 repeat protein n=1 Tax=Gallionella capsiferriformans (strain ES-2) TaxID=395494 RepID=D9SJC8_GALCS|nr:tetratricopeptide repeat protein [Gallionella capsiferriformans]ADL56316.1 tetratricopeptide TPR_2 repeat protein [Gallionella capsiferriformans ES-2]
MSLLLDALKRAQSDENKHNTAPQPESGVAINAPHTHALMAYSIAALAVLSLALIWYFYHINQYVPVSNPPRDLASAASAASAPSAASSTVALDSPLAALPPTASGVDSLTYKDKSWTHPVDTKNPERKKHKPAKKGAKRGIIASTAIDPLKAGYLALSEGNLDRAEQYYLSVLAQRPQEKDALLGLAVIAQRRNHPDRATEYYRQVLREDLGNAAAAAGLASLTMHADPVTAESQLHELIDLKPTAPEFHYALGGVLARQLRWGEAQQSYFKAFNLSPNNALYAYNLAVSLDRLHQSAAALPYYEKAIMLAKPEDPTLDMDQIERRIQELRATSPESR